MDPLTLFDLRDESEPTSEAAVRFVDHTQMGIGPPSPETVAELDGMNAQMKPTDRFGAKDAMMDEKYAPTYGRKIRRKKKGDAKVGDD